MDERKRGSLFAAGKAKWLLQNVDKLSEDERALLLAIAELERDSGREVTPDEQKALDKLAAKIAEADGIDPQAIAAAVNQMMTAETKHPIDEWPSAVHRIIKRKKQN